MKHIVAANEPVPAKAKPHEASPAVGPPRFVVEFPPTGVADKWYT